MTWVSWDWTSSHGSASWPLRPRPRTSSAACRRKSGRSSRLPEVKEKFAAQGSEMTYLPASEFDRFLAREREQWAQAVKVSGAKLD